MKTIRDTDRVSVSEGEVVLFIKEVRKIPCRVDCCARTSCKRCAIGEPGLLCNRHKVFAYGYQSRASFVPLEEDIG